MKGYSSMSAVDPVFVFSSPHVQASTRTFYKVGIVGGGIGSTMGPLHLNAIALTRRAKLVCGCFSSDPMKSRIAGVQYGLHRNRVYKEWNAVEETED